MSLVLAPAQVRALCALRVACPDSRCVLVGAAALGFHLPLPRSTADIDLAMLVAPEDLDELLVPMGWVREPRALQRWRAPEGVLADVLPMSEALLRAGELRFGGDDFVMSLVGFDLAIEHTVVVPLADTGVDLEIASLPALVVLKLVAWLDRPYERTKDLADLAHVLAHALPADDERRWDLEHPVFLSGLEHEFQSAFFIGGEVARIAKPLHRRAVARFFGRMSAPNGIDFGLLLREARDLDPDREARLEQRLAAFRQGLDARHPA